MKKKKYKSSAKHYCDDCDGVGWVEGGECLQSTCKRCDGTGILKTTFWMEGANLYREEKPYYPKERKQKNEASND